MDVSYRRRPLAKGDEPVLREIFYSSWDRALMAAQLPEAARLQMLDQQFMLQHHSYPMQYPKADFDLLLQEDEVVGRIYVDRGPEQFVLIEFTLLPSFRRKGLGSKVMRDLLAEAEGALKPVQLHVEHWNPEARKWYQRLGFVDVEDIGTHWKMRWEPQEKGAS